MKKRLNVGIIGGGSDRQVHAETLAFRLPEANTVVIADLNREAAHAVASRCGIGRVADSAEESWRTVGGGGARLLVTDTHARLIGEAARRASTSSARSGGSLPPADRRSAAAVEKAASIPDWVQPAVPVPISARVRRRRGVRARSARRTPAPSISRDPAPPRRYVRRPGDVLDMTIHDFTWRGSCWARSREIYTAAGVMEDRIASGRRRHGVITLRSASARSHDRQLPQGRVRLRHRV